MSFLNKKYTRASLTLAIPVMLTQVGQVSVNLFDNIIVGKLLGADALASVSLANGVFFAVFVFGLGFSFAIPPLVSEAHVNHNHKEINLIFRHGFVINMTVAVFLMAILYFSLPLIYHLDQPPKILPKTISYLSIMILTMIPFMLFQTLREVSEGLSYTIGVTKATIAANVVNIILNYIFIKGLFGFSPMGVEGSAYATLIARIFMVFLLYFILRSKKQTRRYILDFSLKIKSFSKEFFEKMIRLGFPTALQMFFEISAFAAAAFICGLVSAKDIASHQIALSMASFTFNLCIGFSVASTVQVGRRLGEGDYKGVKEVGINNLKIAFLFMLLCGTLFILGRHILPTFFTQKNDVDVILLASKLLIVAALFQLSDGIQVTALGGLRGLQDVKTPSFITFIAYWLITIPLAYFLCFSLKMGAFGVWIALGIGLSISAFLLVLRFLKLADRKISLNLSK